MDKKAIALVSGGLDSLLAARLIMQQGVEVLGVVFVMQFASRDVQAFKKNVREAANGAGIPIRFVDISEEFLDILKNPSHGYGANLNPCIDCKILMLKRAKKIMEEENASFVVTGEVLGERPMSQRKDALDIIKRQSSLGELLLRPLSAKFFKESLPEKKGIVDRAKLLDIEGRSRERQLALAKEYGLKKFFTPAGGCLLTDPIFTKKLKDLMDSGCLADDDIALLKYGRHFRLDKNTKVIVGRDEKDNEQLLSFKKQDDVIIRLKSFPGPHVLLRGKTSSGNIAKAAALGVSYSKKRNEDNVEVEFWTDKRHKNVLIVDPLRKPQIEEIKIA